MKGFQRFSELKTYAPNTLCITYTHVACFTVFILLRLETLAIALI